MNRLEADSAKFRAYYKTVEDFPNLLTDDQNAMCDQQTFDALLDYSASFPSGQFLGKIWKCSDAYDRNRDRSLPLKWRLVEYTACETPGLIGLKWRALEVIA